MTSFFDAAVTYGIPTLRRECFSWLLKNLMTSSPEFLAGISLELMTELVDNADLFVMQVRQDGKEEEVEEGGSEGDNKFLDFKTFQNCQTNDNG